MADDWLSWGQAKGLSPRTADGRRDALRRFFGYCEGQGVSTLDEVTSRVIDRYSVWLQGQTSNKGKPYAKHSVAKWVKEVNQFMAWANRESDGPRASGQAPTTPRLVKPVLSRAEIQAMEDAATTERDKLIVRLLADTGMRLSELLLLRTSDLSAGTLLVRGKGRGGHGEERLLKLNRDLAHRIARYIERSRPKSDRDELWLALRRSRTTGQYEPLSESGVQQLVAVAAREAGIKRRVHPHLFRHSAATYLLQKGINNSKVALTLGWKSTQMIDRHYGHLVDSDAWDDVLKAMAE